MLTYNVNYHVAYFFLMKQKQKKNYKSLTYMQKETILTY